MNIALVVLDTLRKDAFDEYFEWLPGCHFEQAWAPGNWTVPVHGAMFTGNSPAEAGIHAKHQTLDCTEPVLSEILQDEGYDTYAFSSNPNISPIFKFDRGFQEFRGSWRLRGINQEVFDWETFITSHQSRGVLRYFDAIKQIITGNSAIVPSLRRGLDIKLRDIGIRSTPADDGAKQALSYINAKNFDDCEFLFVNLMEAHAPYDPPKHYHTIDVGGDDRGWTTYSGLLATITGGPPEPATANLLRQAYDDSVQYLSDIYKEIFKQLQADFDMIITLGDHGELFGEQGGWQHAYGLQPQLTHVPLVISGETVDETVVEAKVDLKNIFHTIRNIADDSFEDQKEAIISAEGDPRMSGGTVYTEYHGVSRRNWQRVEAEGLDPSSYDQRLFGVVNQQGEYGYETIAGFEPSNAEDEMHELINEYKSETEFRRPNNRKDIPVSVERQLEDLGYA